MLNIFILFFFIFQQPQTWANWENGNSPLAALVDLSITTNKDFYYVHEPMRLQITLKNKSNKIMSGSFQPNFKLGLKIYYRRKGSEFAQFICQKQSSGKNISIVAPQLLEPQGSVNEKEWVTFDTASKQFVLAEPGQYELKAVYHDWPRLNDPQREVISPIINVQVLSAPNSDLEVVKQLDRESLGLLFQDDYPIDQEETYKSVEQLSRLMENYSGSVYDRYIRRGLYRALCIKGIRTEADKRLYNKVLNINQPEVTDDNFIVPPASTLEKMKELDID